MISNQLPPVDVEDALQAVTRHGRPWWQRPAALAAAAALVVAAGVGGVLTIGRDDDATPEPAPAPKPRVETVTLPFAGTVDTVEGFGALWVTGYTNNQVAKLDPATGKVLDVIDTPRAAAFATVSDDAVWVTSPEADSVMRIDPTTGEVDEVTDPQMKYPLGIAAAEGLVWVASMHSRPFTVFGIDPDSREVAQRVRLGWERTNGSPAVGPRYIEAVDGELWTGVVSLEQVLGISASTYTVEHRVDIQGTGCGNITGGDGWVWANGCEDTGLAQIDTQAEVVERTLMAGAGVCGVTYLEGSLWACTADGLEQIDPADGATVSTTKLPFTGTLTAAYGDLWVTPEGPAESDRILRIDLG